MTLYQSQNIVRKTVYSKIFQEYRIEIMNGFSEYQPMQPESAHIYLFLAEYIK